MYRAFLVASLLASGCGAYTVAEQEERLSKVIAGQTTQAEIRELARQPDGVQHRDGREIWIWSFTSKTPARGGYDEETRLVTIEFDENGVVRSVENKGTGRPPSE
jgi:hypothetical protein